MRPSALPDRYTSNTKTPAELNLIYFSSLFHYISITFFSPFLFCSSRVPHSFFYLSVPPPPPPPAPPPPPHFILQSLWWFTVLQCFAGLQLFLCGKHIFDQIYCLTHFQSSWIIQKCLNEPVSGANSDSLTSHLYLNWKLNSDQPNKDVQTPHPESGLTDWIFYSQLGPGLTTCSPSPTCCMIDR